MRYRPEIDGLRAVAIAAVVLFHAAPRLASGGFIGVDIFFVISGFLITSLLAAEMDSGAFSFAGFYARRARRILPALFFMLAVTTILFSFLLMPNEMVRYGMLLRDTVLFYANFYLAGEPGYFDGRSQDNPLLHVWSLAVEEQFYFLWPGLLFVLHRRLTPSRLRNVIFLLASLSLAVSAFYVWKSPRAAFYLLPSRGFELLAGALIALGGLPAPRTKVTAEVGATAGLAMMMAAIALFSPETPFPGLAAIVPVGGCALVIWAEGGFQTAIGQFLRLRPVVFLGLISYSLYLWHWPLLCVPKQILQRGLGSIEALACVAVALVVATLSWRFIERPFRTKSTFGLDYRHRQNRFGLSRAGMAAIACALVLVGTGVYARNDGAGWRWPKSEYTLLWYFQSGRSGSGGYDTHTIIPHIVKVAGYIEYRPKAVSDGSAGAFLMWSDSHGGHFFDALNRNLGPGTLFFGPGCPPVLNANWYTLAGKERTPGCPEWRQMALDAIHQRKPKLVVLASKWDLTEGVAYGPENLPIGFMKENAGDPANLAHSRTTWANNLRRTVQILKDTGARVLLMGQVPDIGINVRKCMAMAMRFGLDDAPCTSIDRKVAEERVAFEHKTLADIAADNPDVAVFWPFDSLCDQDRCYAARDGKIFYHDGDHLSDDGAARLAPALRAFLEDQRLLPLQSRAAAADTSGIRGR